MLKFLKKKFDTSNAYPTSSPNDIPGVYESKEAIRYPILIIDDEGNKQYGLVWHFIKAGGIILPHKHNFRHHSVLIKGSVIVTGEAEGRNNIPLVADDIIRFEAGVEHSIKALVDDTHMIHLYPINVMGDES